MNRQWLLASAALAIAAAAVQPIGAQGGASAPGVSQGTPNISSPGGPAQDAAATPARGAPRATTATARRASALLAAPAPASARAVSATPRPARPRPARTWAGYSSRCGKHATITSREPDATNAKRPAGLRAPFVCTARPYPGTGPPPTARSHHAPPDAWPGNALAGTGGNLEWRPWPGPAGHGEEFEFVLVGVGVSSVSEQPSQIVLFALLHKRVAADQPAPLSATWSVPGPDAGR